MGTPAGCGRSNHNYPALIARSLKLDPSQVRDVSCSGAEIGNLTTAQSTGNGTNPARLNALTAETTLVTLGIGGNDIDFTALLTRCVTLDAPGTVVGLLRGSTTTADRNLCSAHYTAGGTDRIQQKFQAASSQLAAVLAQIHGQAPHARVFIVGYPDLQPPLV